MHYSTVWLLVLSLLSAPAILHASSIIVTGDITANREVVLSTRIMGRITKVHAEEGDSVNLGQVIIELDDQEYQARLRIAEASRERTKAELAQRQRTRNRLQELTKTDAVSQDAVDEAVYGLEVAEANVKSAQAEIESIQSTLAETRIKVPFDAVVIKKMAEEGLVTQPGQALYEIQDQSSLKFRARVKERDLARIKVDDRAMITISALRSEPVEARVIKVIPSGDSRHTFLMEMSVPNLPGLYPGMFGKAVFE
jgi:RND family efflux transporter MFP subunit